MEVVKSYKYLFVHLDNRLDWRCNIEAVYRKGQSRLYFLRKLTPFNVHRKMLHIFYQSVVASAVFAAFLQESEGPGTPRDLTKSLGRLSL